MPSEEIILNENRFRGSPTINLSCGLWKQNLKGQSKEMILTTIYGHGSVCLKFKFQSKSVFQKISNKLTAKTAEYEETEISLSQFVHTFQFRKPLLQGFSSENYYLMKKKNTIQVTVRSGLGNMDSHRPAYSDSCPSDRCPPTYLLRNMNILI